MMNKKELNTFFESIYPTKEQKKTVLDSLLSMNSIKAPIKKRTYSIVIVAAILLITSLSVLAATFNWHEKLIEYFNPTQEQMESYQGMIDTPQVSATDNGITVNILQTIADSHGISVFYEIIGNDDIAVDETVSWETNRLKLKYKDSDKIVGTGGYSYNRILNVKNNKCTALYVRSGFGEITSQNITFELNGLRKFEYDENKEIEVFKKIADCSFNISWDFKYENLTEEFYINSKINDNKNTISQIDISPISIWIMIVGNEYDFYSFNDNIKVNLSNGDTVIVDKEDISLSYSPLNGGLNCISFEFNNIIDVSNVISIFIDNKVIDIN